MSIRSNYAAIRAREADNEAHIAREANAEQTFSFYSDPGHGWLRVSGAAIADVGLTIHDFSKYSYWKDNNLYLEEDCDAPKFLRAYEAKYGSQPEIRERHCARDSKIRGFMRLPVVTG